MRRKLILAGCILVLALAALLLWPTTTYDLSRVHPSLSKLVTPYRTVSTGYYLDGGSIGITIVDRDSQKLQLALPVSSERGRSYPRLFIGARHMTETGAVEVAFSEDTRAMLISILDQYQNPADDSDIALVELRGAAQDFARIAVRAASGFCQSLFR